MTVTFLLSYKSINGNALGKIKCLKFLMWNFWVTLYIHLYSHTSQFRLEKSAGYVSPQPPCPLYEKRHRFSKSSKRRKFTYFASLSFCLKKKGREKTKLINILLFIFIIRLILFLICLHSFCKALLQTSLPPRFSLPCGEGRKIRMEKCCGLDYCWKL